MERTAQFEQLRNSLFLLAYRMLGTRTDAEDVVQDAYLRWLKATDEEIRMPRSYLTTVVSRLSQDALKSAQRKREVYTGQWLPEPLVEPLGSNGLRWPNRYRLHFYRSWSFCRLPNVLPFFSMTCLTPTLSPDGATEQILVCRFTEVVHQVRDQDNIGRVSSQADIPDIANLKGDQNHGSSLFRVC